MNIIILRCLKNQYIFKMITIPNKFILVSNISFIPIENQQHSVLLERIDIQRQTCLLTD